MSVGVLSTIFFVLFTYVQCSSIITRNMIRMADNPSLLDTAPHSRLLEPERLTRITEDTGYQQVFPPEYQENNGSKDESRSLESPGMFPSPQGNPPSKHFQTTIKNSTAQISPRDAKQNGKGNEYILKRAWSTDSRGPEPENKDEENSFSSMSNISSEEFSNRYWEKYKNLSYDFLNSSNILQTPVNDLVDDKGFQDTSVWEVLQSMYDCPWSSGIFYCLRESLNPQLDSFFQVLEPQFPRFHQRENPLHHELDVDGSDMDEGRKKLSKKLQLVLPLLMMLKMTMLPALAVMALVSGKAFLLSLLSLGVALVAATVQPAALSASKRHEIAPQAPTPSDRLPNNHPYYYVM